MKRSGVLLVVLAALAFCGSAQGAATATDVGQNPSPVINAYTEDPGAWVRIQAWGNPRADLEVHVTLRCEKGSVSRSVERKLAPAWFVSRRLGWPIKHADECSVFAYAGYVGESPGRSRITLTARQP